MSEFDSLDKNMPILVVDDYPTMRRVLKNCLCQLGFKNIHEAENGQVALEKLESSKFQLVISDWHMPQMAGIDLLKAVRSSDRLKEMPFLMITPEAHKDQNAEIAQTAGVSNTIVKPFTATALEKKMEAIFSKE
jgi:two-component system chemotaxis response regulator CheY